MNVDMTQPTIDHHLTLLASSHVAEAPQVTVMNYCLARLSAVAMASCSQL